METLKIVSNRSGGYLGVYYIIARCMAAVRVAPPPTYSAGGTGLSWTSRRSQPTVAALSAGGFVVAAEADNPGVVRPCGNADTFGVPLLTLHPDGYAWRFVPSGGTP